jgi:ABC-type branched-subunit amino acid transport system ATPase component
MSAPILEVRHLTKRFDGIDVLDGITFDVAGRTIHGIIGPNGAGKTTLFNVLNGIYTATSGTVILDGHDITNKSVHAVASLGLGRTFQVARLFDEMTLMENMLVPAVPKRLKQRDAVERAMALLELAGLARQRDQLAIESSGGQRKLLEFMRTMMGDPSVILLDEPFGGINPALVDRLSEIIIDLNRERGKTFLLISHEMPQVSQLCGTVTVLAAGRMIASGTPAEMRAHPAVIEAYLGQ